MKSFFSCSFKAFSNKAYSNLNKSIAVKFNREAANKTELKKSLEEKSLQELVFKKEELYKAYLIKKQALTNKSTSQVNLNKLYKNYLALTNKLDEEIIKKPKSKSLDSPKIIKDCEQSVKLNLIKEAFSHYYRFDTGVSGTHFAPYEPYTNSFDERFDDLMTQKASHVEQKITNIIIANNHKNLNKELLDHYDLDKDYNFNEYDDQVVAPEINEIANIENISKDNDDFANSVDLEDVGTIEYKEKTTVSEGHFIVNYSKDKSLEDTGLIKNRII